MVLNHCRRITMRVKAIDVTSPRSDGRSKVTSITLGKEYVVAAIEGDRYVLVSDKNKLTRHSQYRFEVVDDSPVLPVREAYNMLTHPVRMKANELERRVEELEIENRILKKKLEEKTSE